VLVVDARPEISGENMACKLLSVGIKCSHMALDALTHMMKDATKVMLGASAVKSNGAAVARAGSALVAMASSNARKPVLICAQSIKFHDEVQLESITSNEQGDPLVRLFACY
jgi:translation initiation factor eIF-2B subunit delta